MNKEKKEKICRHCTLVDGTRCLAWNYWPDLHTKLNFCIFFFFFYSYNQAIEDVKITHSEKRRETNNCKCVFCWRQFLADFVKKKKCKFIYNIGHCQCVIMNEIREQSRIIDCVAHEIPEDEKKTRTHNAYTHTHKKSVVHNFFGKRKKKGKIIRMNRRHKEGIKCKWHCI